MNLNEIQIIKNDGSREQFNADKINNHISFACDGLDVDSVSIVRDARLKLYDGARSSDIQESLIKSAAEKISEEAPDYEICAGRLLNQMIRKEVYRRYKPIDFKQVVRERIADGFYTTDLSVYTDEELDYFGSLIDYELDNNLPYSALVQLKAKYLIKHKGRAIETPQEVYMLIPMAIFAHEPKEIRDEYIFLGYELLSKKKISLPTPIMNGARTTQKTYISCNVIDSGDSAVSLAKTMEAIMMATANKAGLGVNVSKIRGLGASVGNPEKLKHTGILPLIKTMEAATGSLTQVSRSGSVTLTIPFYHYEIELFSQLGDSKGSLENRARHTDQSIILNKWFLRKALNKEDIYLFHMNAVPELYDALGYEDRFDALFEKYAKEVPEEHKVKINAYQLLNTLIFERAITGRVYFVFADNFVKTAFKKNIYNSNLCVAYDTKILTKEYGNAPIGELVTNGIKSVTAWNGTKWSNKTILAKTNDWAKLLKVEFGDGTIIEATPQHKWLIFADDKSPKEVTTEELQPNDVIYPYYLPNQDERIIGVTVVSVTDEGKMGPTYCGNEPIDHCLTFNGIRTKNCQEIALPQSPLDGSEGEPEIACCILGNMNLGYTKSDEIRSVAKFLVRFLDNLIDVSEYNMDAIRYAAIKRRTLGIGISNLFGYLAKSKQFYNQESTRQDIHNIMEKFSYELTKASMELAKERGKCELFNETVYSEGRFIHERFGVDYPLTQDWESLRQDILKYGMRNSTLMAVPPAATSSVPSSATPGVEPPRELVTSQTDKHTVIKRLVPFYKSSKNYYTTAWGMDFNNQDYLKLIATIQKFVDQTISINTYHNSLNNPDRKIFMRDILDDMVLSFNSGVCTWYYANFLNNEDSDGLQDHKEAGCESGGCSV